MRSYFRFACLSLFTVLISAASAAAQPATIDQAIQLGAKAGITVANLKGSSVGHAGDTTGLSLGGFASKRFSPNFGLQAEVLFNQRGAKFESGETTGAFRASYIDIPLLVQLGAQGRWGSFFYACAGPTFSRKLSASLKENGADVPGFSDDNIGSSDVGFTFGLGAQGDRLSFDARYTIGSSAVEKGTSKITNRAFSAMAGVRLW